MTGKQERKAGRELDREIAIRVLGYVWRVNKYSSYDGGDGVGGPGAFLIDPKDSRFGNTQDADGAKPHVAFWGTQVREYSKQIAAAFAVVEAMRARGFEFRLEADASWVACFDHALVRTEFPAWEFEQTDDSAPLATCRSVLALLDEFPEIALAAETAPVA